MKKVIAMFLVLTLMLSSIACNVISSGITSAESADPGKTVSPDDVIEMPSDENKTEETPAVNVEVPGADDTDAPDETPVEPSEEPVIEPEPTPEPVITYGEINFVPAYGDMPVNYTRVTDDDSQYTLCVFVDNEGNSQWRIFAEQETFADGEPTTPTAGWLKCHVKSAVIRIEGNPSYKVEPDIESGFVAYENEVFGDASEYDFSVNNETDKYENLNNVVFATYSDVNPETMTEEPVYHYMYPAADGIAAPGAVPVEIDDDFNLWYIVPGGDRVLVGSGAVADAN